MLQHARNAVQMASAATDTATAIAAAKAVVYNVEKIIGCSATSSQVGLQTLERAAALSTNTEEENAEILYTAKLLAAVTYAAAVEATSAAYVAPIWPRKRRAHKGYRLLADTAV